MANWRSRAHFGLQTSLSGDVTERSRRRRQRLSQRSLHIDPLEERNLFAISPSLVAIIPNEGAIIPFQNGKVTVAPRELTLRFQDGQVIDPATLASGISIVRANSDDNFGNGNDITVPVGYVGIGENKNDVIVRFAGALPDDFYRVQITSALKNTSGDAATGKIVNFDLDLGAQVVAVVPQPVTRDANGVLHQQENVIEVYFNNDDLGNLPAKNPAYYQLIRTGGTANNQDDLKFTPTLVDYDSVADKAVLTFAANVVSTAGSYRLRIGNDDAIPLAPTTKSVNGDPGSTFATANDLGTPFTLPPGPTRLQAVQLSSSIDPQAYTLVWPGTEDEPGHRQLPSSAETHLLNPPDTIGGIPTFYYNFRDDYGLDPNGQALHNLITESQKQRAREVFSLYSQYAGVQFVETADQGITVATGDMRAVSPLILGTGQGGFAAVAGSTDTAPAVAVMDFAEDWGENEFAGLWFRSAMFEIGTLVGLGVANDLPQLTVQTNAGIGVITAEDIVPGDADIVHLQNLYRPDSKDIDTYKFTLTQKGTLSLETVAQRLGTNTTGWLDSVISLYDTSGNLIVRNDDYYGQDSFLKLDLNAGTYFVAITASGNTAFDLNVPDSGMGGRTQGAYQLQLDFTPDPTGGLTDATGVLFDGDADGKPGGAYNFWFRTQTSTALPATNRVLWVDAAAAPGGNGTLAAPYKFIKDAIGSNNTILGGDPLVAGDGYIIRIVGNGGADKNLSTIGDNLSYNIGYNIQNGVLSDGATLEIPADVTVMIDAGTIFRMRSANIDVGTSAEGLDRANGALQVLGTPTNSVIFSSWHDQSTGVDTDPISTSPSAGDWGGLVFREDADLEQEGIFLNYINHADLRYGGGQVVVNSVPQAFDPIYMVEARPTISFSKITNSARAAISANPNSFEETEFRTTAYAADYDRVGPDIHGNTITNNTINGLFVRIDTNVGENLQRLTKSARFDDTDIVHVISESLVIAGDAGEGTLDDNTGIISPIVAGRLAVDPGVIVKLSSARIETELGAQFLAEGTASNPVIFTSLLDDRYGRGGTFDTSNDGVTFGQAGQWAGFYFGAGSSASIDHALITFAGGSASIEGGSAFFNAVQINEADVRLAHSILENNAAGIGPSSDPNRNGRLTNGSAVIFVRGAQPRLIGNVIRHNLGSAVSINVNSLNSFLVNDTGRSTGPIDLAGNFYSNVGPLVTGNMLDDNGVNGMEVRGGTLTTQSVWDDTDIVHVVFNEIIDLNFHTYGGLRLQSTPGHSLVVKLAGPTAGFTASGVPLAIDDRIGGTVQIIGVAGAPVILTSLRDDSVGAGRKSDGTPQTDTNNDGASTGQPGDWRGIKLDEYSNDRNVAVVNEFEQGFAATGDTNKDPAIAQGLGLLAPNQASGDDNARLGFEVHGAISQTFQAGSNRPGDVDVYSFQATAGTEIWIDIDRTAQSLDAVVEVVNAAGGVVASSNDSTAEAANADPITMYSPSLGGAFGTVRVLQRDLFSGEDFYTTNTRDPGMRVTLSGTAGAVGTYYVRVRANSATPSNLASGQTAGAYQLQIRLQEADEVSGTTIQYASINYSVSGIQVLGKPSHSPLLGEASETTGFNHDSVFSQELGNLLANDRNTIAVSGNISAIDDIDWYTFKVNYGDTLPLASGERFWSTIFDLDYADGTGRVNANLAVFDSAGHLVYWSKGGGVDDDQPRPLSGTDSTDLSRGSFGALDPYIGSVDLKAGDSLTDQTYYVAVSSNAYIPLELDQFTSSFTNNQTVRLEPVEEYNRVFTNRVEGNSGTQKINLNANTFNLSDVITFASSASDLYTINPFTGKLVTTVTPGGATLPNFGPNFNYGDIVMRNDGKLFTFTRSNNDVFAGNMVQLDPGDGTGTTVGLGGIITYKPDPNGGTTPVLALAGFNYNAVTFVQNGPTGRHLYAVGSYLGKNLLVELNPDDGSPLNVITAPATPPDPNTMLNVAAATLVTAPTIVAVGATDQIAPTNSPGDITDGQTLQVDGAGTVIFEFNTGYDVRMASTLPSNLDGQSFTITDGNNVLKTFEFDQGAFVTVQPDFPGGTVQDGDTLTLTKAGNNPVVLTFVAPGNPPAANEITITSNATLLASRIATAINNSGLTTQATSSGNGIGVPTGIGLSESSDGLTVSGGSVTGIPIHFEFGDSIATIGAAIQSAVNTAFGGNSTTTGSVTVSFARDRVTFNGGGTSQITADFSLTPFFVNVQGTDNPGNTLNVITINAGDDATAIASKIALRITQNAGTLALNPVANGGTVAIVGGTATPTAPIAFQGVGGGGDITGLASISSGVFAVSEGGSLYRVNNPGPSATLSLVNTFSGIQFTGLSAGPQNVEGGIFADILFATDASGTVYAFDAAGVPQGIFLDGATSVATGQGGLNGIAFSTLDYNLWHVSGTEPAVGGSEGHSGGTGKSSYYFGLDDPTNAVTPQLDAANYSTNSGLYGTYNLPGGAQGSLTTDPIDLSGYISADLPTLYFSYYYEVESSSTRDDAKVYVSSDGGNGWTLLTNDLFKDALFWRQARLDLSAFAGQKDVRIRFDFSTAGDLEIGKNLYGGELLQAPAGRELEDGYTFTVDGQVFEFDLGQTLILKSAPQIVDGDKVTINGTIYEFDKNNSFGLGNVPIVVTDTDTAEDIAVKLAAQIGALAHQQGATVNLDSGAAVILGGSSVSVIGSNGTANTPVVVNFDSTAEDVAQAMAVAMDTVLAVDDPNYLQSAKVDGSVLHIYGHDVTQSIYVKPGSGITDGDKVTINGRIFEFNKTGGVSGTNAAVNILDTDSASAVATKLANVIANQGLVGLTVNANGATVNLISAVTVKVTNASPSIMVMGLTKTLPDDHPTPAITPDRFFSNTRGQDNNHQGLFIDDIILGFASRGEMAFNTFGLTFYMLDPTKPSPDPNINTGLYDLEIRRGSEPERLGFNQYDLASGVADTIGRIEKNGDVPVAIDVRSRLSQQYTLTVPSGAGIVEGETFQISDGQRLVTFEFDSDGTVGSDAQPNGVIVQRQKVVYNILMTEADVATAIRNAVNDRTASSKIPAGYGVQAGISGRDIVDPLTGNLRQVAAVELFNAAIVVGSNGVDYEVHGGDDSAVDQLFTLLAKSGDQIVDGDSFAIWDSNDQLAFFQFMTSIVPTPGVEPVLYSANMSAGQVANAIKNAINNHSANQVPAGYSTRAYVQNSDSPLVELFGASFVFDGSSLSTLREHFIPHEVRGDSNEPRDQGYTIVSNNIISNASQFGILVDADTADGSFGAPRNLRVQNTTGLVPGVSLMNNLVVNSGQAGIKISGDSNTDSQNASLFARVINNTIYGGATVTGTGILVDQGASPTIMNNIVANNVTGIQVTGGGVAVLEWNLYKGNTTNRSGAADTSNSNIDLAANAPLFVDPANGNFYLANGSKAIDSALATLQDRPALTTVSGPLGIPPSTMVAPAVDLLGQLRVDDPGVTSGLTGQGANVFKDRGAIDRSDFLGPSAVLVNPLDNDPNGVDTNPALTQVQLVGQSISNFSIQFTDGAGAGIANNTVTSGAFTFKRNGGTLVEGTDYIYSYDNTSRTVRFQSVSGLFAAGTYTIQINNTVAGIRDIADNLLKPNQVNGDTLFTIGVPGGSIWQNPVNSLDVDNDGDVFPFDVLLVVNYLRSHPTGELDPNPNPLPPNAPNYYFDVDGDGKVTFQDIIPLVEFLKPHSSLVASSFSSGSNSATSSLVSSASTTSTSNLSASTFSSVAVGASIAQSTQSSFAGTAVTTTTSGTLLAASAPSTATDEALATYDESQYSLVDDDLLHLAGGTWSGSDEWVDDDELDAILV